MPAPEDGKVSYRAFFDAFIRASAAEKGALEPSGELRYVLLVTRHGARFPLKNFEHCDAWPKHKAFWESYGGKLSVLGQSQMVELGKGLRAKYISGEGLLYEDDPDLPQHVYTYSSNTDRTVMSAQGVLLGLLPKLPHSFIHSLEVSPTAVGTAQHISIRIADLETEYTPLLHGYKQNPRCAMQNMLCSTSCC